MMVEASSSVSLEDGVVDLDVDDDNTTLAKLILSSLEMELFSIISFIEST
jgi:hypothetical protein